ncbi:hypothetical protein T265_14344, partial [Opisthorchis viverrini]
MDVGLAQAYQFLGFNVLHSRTCTPSNCQSVKYPAMLPVITKLACTFLVFHEFRTICVQAKRKFAGSSGTAPSLHRQNVSSYLMNGVSLFNYISEADRTSGSSVLKDTHRDQMLSIVFPLPLEL